ncbi:MULTISPECIES: FimV/HubP family polar landmark protein [Pseudomonas]|uniref:FimV/HubP family polar landmark protein n=1 Tax=Pseudomonas sp. Hg7Tf TaxID=3236988 RepID=A0AB39I5X7_9PSED|nr:FimV/HubP family polar landmark protein [Pseudomonas sp. Hg5Tf]MDH2557930.1 FimV/HubP family polar landmark protein [Pseudomonas sp. Hg5Tf]
MLRIRKLVLAIAAASALSSGMAHALGLGELTLKSAQNQPLDAEIELLDVRDLTAAEVAPSLAPAEEFAKAGIERQAYLNDLTFTPVINPNGKSVLRVTSSQPLPAPMVKFMVQVMWPSGRLLRDYSVLVNQAALPGAKPQAAIAPAVSAPANYTTVRRDTLWEIASKARQGGSVQQAMLAIQALNPDAFINGNINLLKTGQVLRLPDQQQVMSIPQGEAVTEVAEQYAAWRQGRRLGPRARQLDATRRTGTEATPAQIANQDNLRLVAPSSKTAAGDGKAVSDKLALAQESLDTTRRDNAELKSRMSDLQSQLDKLERLIALKNDQLARLEAQGAAGQTPEQSSISAELQPAPSEPVVTPAPAAVDTAPLDNKAPGAEPATAGGSSKMLDDLLGSPLLLALIAASALLVLLLLLLLLARKRKADQEAEKHLRMARALAEESDRSPDLDLPPSSFEGLEMPAPSVTLAPAVVAASAAAASAAEAPAEQSKSAAAKPLEPAPTQPQPMAAPLVAPAADTAPAPSADALLNEVELSIARGRLNHAAELLEPAVAAAPERSDLRLKLMEVYARQGDRDAFVGHERQLIATGQNHADVEALKSRFPAMMALAAGGIGAAALAAEMDAQYVQALLQDEPQVEPQVQPEPEPQVETEVQPEPEPEPTAELESAPEAEPLADDELDSAFDLSLDDDLQDLNLEAPLELGESAPEIELELAPEPVAEVPAVEPEAEVAAEQPVERAPEALDDLSDFDLDVAGDQLAELPVIEPIDIAAELAAFDETMPEFDPLSELELPEDFDLSLSLEDDSDAAKSFASELDDVNAELDKLSQSLEQPSIEPHFTAEDALSDDLGDDLEFDYLGGADEAATKLDLARAYIDMGDHDGARDILDEVRKEGSDAQKQEADEMLSRLV